MNVNKTRDHIIQEAINLLKSNIGSPSNFENPFNWSERVGPWGKTIKNLLIPPGAGDFVTPNKNTFVGQWYWDTMGTNLGLLRSGDDHLRKVALSMVENLFFKI
jgi:neutral trehalase